MTRNKSTPGPWRVSRAYTTKGLALADASVPVLSSDGKTVETVCHVLSMSPFPNGEGCEHVCEARDANTRLIAAAPDMYAALKAIVAEDRGIPPEYRGSFIQAGIAALAKADGAA